MATTLQLIGGGGGCSFEFHGMNNGATLKKIGVAVEAWRVKVVREELVDSVSHTSVDAFGWEDQLTAIHAGCWIVPLPRSS
uniref:Uncharacterized protein n=1 Tax=Oncorhynchus tshawytscha TaxID=74940 RepID=A0AAZ3QGF9_ONCTS